jgi:hypothetical protein
VHLVGFIVRIYHDARSSECQIQTPSHVACSGYNTTTQRCNRPQDTIPLSSSSVFNTEEPQQQADPPPCVRQCLPEIKTRVMRIMRTQERIHILLNMLEMGSNMNHATTTVSLHRFSPFGRLELRGKMEMKKHPQNSFVY